MKKLTFLKTMFLAVVLMVGSLSAFAQTTVTYSFSSSNEAGLNQAKPGIAVDENIGFASFKNSGTSNPVVLNGQLRLYQNAETGGSIKIYANNGVTITQVIVHASGGTGPAAYTVDGGTETKLDKNTIYTMSGLSATDVVEFYQKDAAKANRIYVDKFEVTYTTSSSTEPTLTASPTSLDFGEVNIGETAEKEITVTGLNLTTAPTHTVSGTGFTVAGELTADGGTLTVTYAPTAEGASTGTLTITGDEQTATVALSGTGVTPIAPGEIPDVIISEVYGGGGNSGAPLSHDFVELFNTTGAEIDISGWSIQYYSASGTTPSTTNVFVLPEGSKIPANGHFLIQCAAGSNEAGALPTPDAVAESGMTMGAKSGKVALFSTGDAQDINDISSLLDNPNFKDYVPYGSATPVWGTALGVLTNATSATRKLTNGSYEYTADVGADFEVVKPNPQNSSNVLTGLSKATLTDATAWTANGKVMLNATAGEVIEVYNVAGQKVVSRLATDGLNEVAVQLRGVAIVKVGNRISKVVL